MDVASHVSETSHDMPGGFTSPSDVGLDGRPITFFGKSALQPIEDREPISLLTYTSEEDSMDATMAPPSPAQEVTTRLFRSSPSKASETSDFDLARMRRELGLGADIEDIDRAIAEGAEDDELRGLFGGAEVLRASTPELTRSRSTKASSSPRSPMSYSPARMTGKSSKKRKALAIHDSSDDDASEGPDTFRHRSAMPSESTEEIVVDISSSLKKKHAGDHRSEPLAMVRQTPDVVARQPMEVTQTKLKGLSKHEKDVMNREIAALKRNRSAKLEAYHGDLRMEDLLQDYRAHKSATKAEKPVSQRFARVCDPTQHALDGDGRSPASLTAFKSQGEQHYMGESIDATFLKSQSAEAPGSRPMHRTFTETDPIESTSSQPANISTSMSVDGDDDDFELPDVQEAVERSIHELHKRQEQEEQKRLVRERQNRLRQQKERFLALKQAHSPKKSLLATKRKLLDEEEQSSEADFEIIVEPSARPQLRAPTVVDRHRREVVRSDSQLDRAGKTFGQAKKEPPITHGDLSASLLQRSRHSAAAVRKRKQEDWEAEGNKLAPVTPAAQSQATQDASNISHILNGKKVEEDEDPDEDDDDYNPNAADDDDEEMLSGNEIEAGGSEDDENDDDNDDDDPDDDVGGAEDEYGSADEQAFEVRPDSPKKEQFEQSPLSPSSEEAEDANKENTFSDMLPIARLEERRNPLNASRLALSQLSGEAEDPASPTQVVDASHVIVPYNPGSPVDANALGGSDGFSQLFAEEERGDGPNVFDAKPDSHFLPTQMQHPGRALLPAFEGNAVLNDLVNSQLERQGPLNVIHGTPEARGPRQWLNEEGMLTQHKPADRFDLLPEESPDPFFKNRRETESLELAHSAESQVQLVSSPTHRPIGAVSVSPLIRPTKRIVMSDDDADEEDVDEDENTIECDDDEEPLPDTTMVIDEIAPITKNAFAVLQRGAQREAWRTHKGQKRREANAFIDEQAERSDEEGGYRDRYGQGLLGNDADEDDEGDSDDGKDLEELVNDEKVAPELQTEQDRLARERHEAQLAEDEARLDKRMRGVAEGKLRKKQARKHDAFDSDSDVDEANLLELRRNQPKKRKDDDGTMDSLAANEATAAFARGYAETHNPTEAMDAFGFLQPMEGAQAADSDEEDNIRLTSRTSSRNLRRVAPPSLVVTEDEQVNYVESFSLVGAFCDDEAESYESHTQAVQPKVARHLPTFNAAHDVSSFYIKSKGRTFTDAQRKEALAESQNSHGDGRRAGNARTSAVTSFKQRPSKSASMGPPSKSASVLAQEKSFGKNTMPVKSKSLSSFSKGSFK